MVKEEPTPNAVSRGRRKTDPWCLIRSSTSSTDAAAGPAPATIRRPRRQGSSRRAESDHQALKPWLPATRRRVHLDTLSLLTWPQGVTVESPAFEHFLASVVAPFCARYPTPSTQLLYRRSLTYFFRWWGQAREQDGESDGFTAQLLQRYRAFFTTTQGEGTGTRLAARTINTYLASLRAFCTWLKQTGQIPYHPMGEVKGLKIAKRFVRDSLTEARSHTVNGHLRPDGDRPGRPGAAVAGLCHDAALGQYRHAEY